MRRGLLAALVAGLVAALLALAGCASPPPNLFTLAAVPGPVVPTTVRSVELRRIGLAGYLDRPGIVRANVQYRLNVSDIDRWGEPLGGMLDRVFTEDLVARLPGTAVFAESGAISTTPDATVEIDVQRFDRDADGEVVLLAQVAIRRDGRTATAQTLRLTRPLASDGTAELVAAMSALLGEFADRVAVLLTQ